MIVICEFTGLGLNPWKSLEIPGCPGFALDWLIFFVVEATGGLADSGWVAVWVGGGPS